MIMKSYEWEYLVERTMEFCTLAHTEEERKTEKYYNKRCDMVEEEYVKELEPWLGKYMNDPTKENLIQVADGIGDTIFVTIQAASINSPSALDWGYISALMNSENPAHYRNIFIAPIIDVIQTGEHLMLDVFGITKEICDSNMSKLPKLSEVQSIYGVCPVAACDTASDWIESELNKTETDIVINWELIVRSGQEDRVVFRDQFGKVRKWIGYVPPNLERFIQS